MKEYESLKYWIEERENVRLKKEAGQPKPWSDDPVFQTTYFCNVHREDDKVTKFIRSMYSPHVDDFLFEHNIILSRFLNWPPTLEALGYIEYWDPDYVRDTLNKIRGRGEKVWGNAYVVTTHGIPMDKIDYLCDNVMPSVQTWGANKVAWNSCADSAKSLMKIEGVSTFMAGQVIADLKNTVQHRLSTAKDWGTFVLPGPGSRRGMDWLYGYKNSEADWYRNIAHLQQTLYNSGIVLHAQDLQNCLCEFDKYMRVKNGTGRSKRSYPGV